MEEDRLCWFDPKEMTEMDIQKLKLCRAAYKKLYRELHTIIGSGRRQSIVWTQLEQAAMMTTKAISHG